MLAAALAISLLLQTPTVLIAQSDESRPWVALVKSRGGMTDAPLWVVERRVLELLDNQQSRFDQQAPLRAIARGRGRFRTQADIRNFVARLESRAKSLSTEFARSSGLAEPVARALSESVRRPWLEELQRVAVVEANLGRLHEPRFRATVTAAKLKALGSTLKPGVTLSQLKGAPAARPHAVVMLRIAARQDTEAVPRLEDLVNSETSQWLQEQSPEVRAAVSDALAEATKSGQGVLDTLVASAKTATAEARQRAGEAFLSVSTLSSTLEDVGKQLDREREAVEALAKAAPGQVVESAKASIVGSVTDALMSADKTWNSHYERVKRSVDHEQISKAVSDGQQFLTQFSEFTTLLKEDSASFPRVAASVIASGRLDPTARAAVETLQTFTSSTAGLPAQAEAVVALASVIAPGEMKALQGVMSDVAPVLQAATPLLMLSGFGAPAAFMSVGTGVSVGDSGVMRELGAINAKLDQIIDQLNRIERTIERQHRETMQALEALHWDVSRILSRIQAQDLTSVSNPCAQALDPQSEQSVVRKAQSECFEALNARIRPDDVPEFFRLFHTLKSSADKEALQEWRKIATAHAFVFANMPGQCGPLIAASRTLNTAADVKTQDDAAPVCEALRDRERLVDPSLTSFVVNRDSCVSRSRSVIWSSLQASSSLTRWRSLLFVLNAGVGQQAALAGLAGTDAIGKYLLNDEWSFATSQSASDYGSQQAALDSSLQAFAALPQNALRAAIDARFATSGSGQAAYAVGFRSSTPSLLNAWSGIPAAAGSFVRKSGAVCFASKKLGEAHCIPASTPAEMQRRVIALTGPLQVLLDSRDEILRLVEGARLTAASAGPDLDSLIELITLKHLQTRGGRAAMTDQVCNP